MEINAKKAQTEGTLGKKYLLRFYKEIKSLLQTFYVNKCKQVENKHTRGERG